MTDRSFLIARSRRLLAAVAAAALLGFSAAPLSAMGARTGTLTGEIMSPRFPDGGDASESWNYIFRFPDSGYTVFSRFMIFNTGPGSHRASAVGILVAPDGRRALLKNGRSRRKWTYLPGEAGPEMRLAKHVFRMTPTAHSLHMENGSGSFTIESVSVSEPVFPPPVPLGAEGALERVILSPRMEVTGSAAFPGEEAVDLGRGRGIAYIERSPVADHDSMVSKLMFHTFEGEIEVSLLQFRGTRESRYRSSSLLLLVKDGKVFLWDTSADVAFSSFNRDEESPNYLVPGAFSFRDEVAGSRIAGEVLLSRTWRYDWLDGLDNPLAKLFLDMHAHPVQSEYEAFSRIQIDVGGYSRTVESEGVAVLHILNAPNWQSAEP